MTCTKCGAKFERVLGQAVFTLVAGARVCLPCGGMPKRDIEPMRMRVNEFSEDGS